MGRWLGWSWCRLLAYSELNPVLSLQKSGIALGDVFAGFAGFGFDSGIEHGVDQADGPAEGAAAQCKKADGEKTCGGEEGEIASEGERPGRTIKSTNADCSAHDMLDDRFAGEEVRNGHLVTPERRIVVDCFRLDNREG